MNGMQMSGTPWLDEPTMLHSSRAYKCSLKSPAQCKYQQGYWRFWYEADHRYALPTVGFFCAVIALFTLVAIWTKVAPRKIVQSKPLQRLTAGGRYLSYRLFRIEALKWNSAPVGVLLLGAVGTIFFFAMTLGPKPYYWPNTKTLSYGNSPPIATRTGWMALACLPFVFVTAGKSNLITMVTGVSHERLQVYHRWISYAFFVLGLIHTFPFIVYHIWKGDMVKVWQTSVVYWTGVVALLAQAWLTFAALSPLRNWSYEFFKFTHFLASLVFAIFFFFHCDFRLSSWDYFIATGVLFALSWLHSQVRTFAEHGSHGKAVITRASNGDIKVAIPTTSTWKPGQHYFLRFMGLGVHSASSHPFTACSLPSRGCKCDGRRSELVFYVRSRSGLTSRLARYADKYPNVPMTVFLDGPHGGINMQKLASSNRMLVVAGGSGAGWALPLIECHLRKLALLPTASKESSSENLTATPPALRVVLATRDRPTRQWFEESVADLIAASSLTEIERSSLSVQVYYTKIKKQDTQAISALVSADKSKPAGALESDSDPELALKADNSSNSGKSNTSRWSDIDDFVDRPALPSIVREETAAAGNSSLGVFVCGPTGMQSDVANAIAAEQVKIMKNGAGDIYLHTEHFSWA